MSCESLVSVIIPVYNAEKYLGKCVDSVRNQTYQNLEIWLIDDGCEDHSGSICDELAKCDRRVRSVHQENGGVSNARNAGLEMVSGKWVMFVDADDELTPDCIETLYAAATETKADVAAGKMCNDRIWDSVKASCIWKDEDGLRYSLSDHPFTYSAWAKLFKREIIGDTRFQTNIRVNEDSYFVFQILCKKPTFAGVNEEIYLYNANPESASRAAFSEKFFDILKVAELKYDIIKDKFPHLIQFAENMMLKAEMNLLAILANRTGREYRAIERRLINQIRANRKSYISAKKCDDRWFLVIQYGLYFPYKFLKRAKKRLLLCLGAGLV